MQRVALVGAYSMSNYGDQLYPPILEALLRESGFDGNVGRFALHGGELADGRRIERLSALAAFQPDAVLVGGGDLIRSDRTTVALDHLCVPSSRRRDPRARLRARRFERRHFARGPGPWLPKDGWGDYGPPVLFASVGVHALPSSSDVRDALAHVERAWVRTHHAHGHLVDAGLASEQITVAPDAVFALPAYVDADQLQARGEEIFRTATGRAGPAVVLHAAEFTGWTAPRVTALLRELGTVPTVVLALGRYAGEDQMLRTAARASSTPFLDVLPAPDATAVLAAAACVVSTSMHAAIVGSCFGSPVVVPGVEKTRSAFEACPQPPTVMNVPDDEVAATVFEMLGHRTAPPADANARAVREALRELVTSMDALGSR